MFSPKLPISLKKADFSMNDRKSHFVWLLLLLASLQLGSGKVSAEEAPMKEFKTQVEFAGGGERDISLEDLDDRESLLASEDSEDSEDVEDVVKAPKRGKKSARQVAKKSSFEQKFLNQSTSFQSTKDQKRSKGSLRALRQERPLRDSDLITLSL